MSLTGRRVAVLAEEGYQELEIWYPVMRLREEGAEVVLAAPETDHAYESRLGYPLLAEMTIAEVDPEPLDAVVIPGGDAGTRLRSNAPAASLVKRLHERGAFIAAIGTGPGLFAEAGLVTGRKVTGDRAIAGDLATSGAEFVDDEVVVDGTLITSRLPDDLPAFFRTLNSLLQQQDK
jgi:protease I